MRTIFTFCIFFYLTFCWAQDPMTINEFMASNDSLSGIQDPAGSYADWIELHNKSNQTVNLEGYQLSDSYVTVDKFVFPEGSEIPANGYVIVWADKDTLEEGFHADFRLDVDGERLILSSPQGMLIDSFSFPQQETNVSYARIPNGTGDFDYRAPTFAANNDVNAAKEPTIEYLSGAVAPNPNTGKMTLFLPKSENFNTNSEINLNIYDASGRFASVPRGSIVDGSSQLEISLDVSHLPTGVYIVQIQTSERTFIEKFLLQK